MELKRILGNTVWYGIIPKLPAILTIFLLPFITPFLTPKDYGVLGVITAYSAIAGSLATFGLHIHLANTYFEYENRFKEKWNQYFSIMFCTSICCAIILGIVFWYVLPEESLFLKIIIVLLSCLSVALIPNQIVANNFFLLANRPSEQVLRNLFSGVIAVLLIYYFVRIEQIGYVGWVIALSIGSLVAFLLFFSPLWIKEGIRPKKIKFKRTELVSVFLISLPVIPHNLGHILMSSSDRIIMSFYNIKTSDIGLYYNGYQISEYVNMVLLGLCTAISPLFQKNFRSNNIDKLVQYYKVSTVFSIFLIVVCILWMNEFYLFFIRNDALQAASEVAKLNVISYVPTVLYFFLSAKILIEKKTKYILWLVFFPAIVNIILNFIFIPIYGYIAAAYTTIISYWLILLIPFFSDYFYQSYKMMFGSRFYHFILILFFILISIVSLFCSDIFFTKIIFTALLFVIVIFYIIFKHFKKMRTDGEF